MIPSGERQFYSLAYAPAGSEHGCHQIKVKVDRRNTRVFTRDEYCAGQSPSDLLAGSKEGGQLESDLVKSSGDEISLSLQAGAFATGPGPARVHIALEFPWQNLYHRWNILKRSLWARVGVLGMIYRKDGSVAARFSDLLYPSYYPMFIKGRLDLGAPPRSPAGMVRRVSRAKLFLSLWDPIWLPSRYETQLDLPPGEYDLKVVLSDEKKFGRAEAPLTIDAYIHQNLTISSVMLCKRYRDAHVAAVERAAANFAPQRVPLVSKGTEYAPAGDRHFKKHQPLILYFEVYEPLLESQPETKVEAHIRIRDAKTGKVIKDFPPVDAASYENPGSTTIPIAREIPFKEFHKGAYRMEVQATDSAGRSTAVRTAEFTIE